MAANIGPGYVTAHQIAGGDIVNENAAAEAQVRTPEQFADLVGELRDLIIEAKEGGELDALLADRACEHLEQCAEMVTKEEKPPKPKLVKKLEAVAEMIDSAVDMFTSDEGGVARTLLKALPIAVLLVRLAIRIF